MVSQRHILANSREQSLLVLELKPSLMQKAKKKNTRESSKRDTEMEKESLLKKTAKFLKPNGRKEKWMMKPKWKKNR